VKFSFGANQKVTGKTEAGNLSYAGAWQKTQGTLADLAEHIGKGHPWMPALLDGSGERWQTNANHAEVLALDHDDGITIEQALKYPFISAHCGLLIESNSSTPEHNKFRTVFRLPEPAKGWQQVRLLNKYLAHVVGSADPACKDASRFFFGAMGRSPVLLNEQAVLPASFVEDAIAWHREIEAAEQRRSEQARKQWERYRANNPEVDIDSLVLQALESIDPDCDYCDWIAVGMALAGMGDQWLGVWDSWSAGAANYKPREMQAKWKSFRGKKPAPEAIFGIAKRYGWKFPKRENPNQKNATSERDRVQTSFSVGLPRAELETRIQAWEAEEDPASRWELWEKIKAESGKTHRDLMALVKALKVKADQSDDDWAISAKQFGSLDLGAKEWLFQGLLPTNRSILIGADAKTGKSLLVYDWAYNLATGQSWGEFPCDRPRKVLIVQTDESEIDCQERINIRGLNELDNVRIIRSFTPDLMPRLKRVAKSWGAEVIIFDSLTSIQRHSGYSPKDPEYGYWLYDLKDFASECRVTPILISHTNKAPIDLGLDKVAGSYSITAAVSEIFMLTRPKDPASDCDRVLIRVGSRSAGQNAWLMQLNLEDFSWEYQFPCTRDGAPLDNDGGFTPDSKLNCRQNIVKFLAHNSGTFYETREIAELLGENYNNVRKICNELRSEGTITRKKAGKPWAYAIHLPSNPPIPDPPEKNLHKNEQEGSIEPEMPIEQPTRADHSCDLLHPDGSLASPGGDLLTDDFKPLSDRELAELLEGGE
jgi:hypothetical protein